MYHWLSKYLFLDPSPADRDCIHVVWFFEEWDWIKELFPHLSEETDESDQIGPGGFPFAEPQNFEDAEVWQGAQEFVSFDVQSGLWKSKVSIFIFISDFSRQCDIHTLIGDSLHFVSRP